jgi:hypothetical protein
LCIGIFCVLYPHNSTYIRGLGVKTPGFVRICTF